MWIFGDNVRGPARTRALSRVLPAGLWFFMQLAETRLDPMSGGGVAYVAHVAGFLAGFGLTAWWRRRQPKPRVTYRF